MKCWCFVRDAGDIVLADKAQNADVQRLFGPGHWEEMPVRFDPRPVSLEELFGRPPTERA
jgi:hypothetical protein